MVSRILWQDVPVGQRMTPELYMRCSGAADPAWLQRHINALAEPKCQVAVPFWTADGSQRETYSPCSRHPLDAERLPICAQHGGPCRPKQNCGYVGCIAMLAAGRKYCTKHRRGQSPSLEGPSVPLSGRIRGNMNSLVFREGPVKDHTIPYGVLCHVPLVDYKPWDDDRLGRSWGAGPPDMEPDVHHKRGVRSPAMREHQLRTRAAKLLREIEDFQTVGAL